MSRLVKIAIILALLVFIVAPGVTGFLVEESIERAESGYGKALNIGPFELVDNSFDRGWFSSDQTVELSLTEPELASLLHLVGGHKSTTMPSLLIDTKATHGVIPLANPSRGGLRPAIAQTETALSLKYGDGTVVALPIKVFSSLGAGQWARVVAESIDTTLPDSDNTLTWDGADISADFGSDTKYDGVLGALKFSGDGSSIEVAPITLKGSFNKTPYAFGESFSEAAIDKIVLSPPQALSEEPLVINEFDGSGGLSLEGDRAVASSNISLGSIENLPVNITGLNLQANYNVDAKALSSFIEESRNLEAQRDSGGGIPDTQAALGAISQLMEQGVSFDINQLDVEVDGSPMSIKFNVNVPKGSGSPQEAMANGEANGNVVIPKSAVEALGEYSPELASGLAMAEMMGFVNQSDGAYRASVSYKNGVLMLNDLPVPLPF